MSLQPREFRSVQLQQTNHGGAIRMKQPQEKSVSEQLKELQAKVEASRGVPTAEELLKRHSMTPLSGQAYERNLKMSKPPPR